MKRLLASALAALTLASPALAEGPERLVTILTAPEPQTQLMAMVLTMQAAQQGVIIHRAPTDDAPGYEELLLRVVDALLAHSRLPDELRDALQTRFEVPQQLEVFALVGFYHTVSSIAGNAELPLEPWAARFSPAG